MIPITAHAVMRYIERVERCTEDEAIIALSSPIIVAAAKFGAPFVKLSGGQRVRIIDGTVVTVLPDTSHAGELSLAGDARRDREARCPR